MTTHCPISIAFSSEGKPVLLYCKSWKCKICRRKLAKDQARRAKYGVWQISQETGETCLFWTFTLGSDFVDLDTAYKALPRLWNTLRMQIERDQKKFLYFVCVEGQPQRISMPHLHALVFAHVPDVYDARTDPHENVKDFAVACGFGYYADEQLVTSEKAAFYIGKYASKELLDAPKFFRRIRTSQKWPKVPEPAHPPYIMRGRKENVDSYLARVEAMTPRTMDEIFNDYGFALDKLDTERQLTQ